MPHCRGAPAARGGPPGSATAAAAAAARGAAQPPGSSAWCASRKVRRAAARRALGRPRPSLASRMESSARRPVGLPGRVGSAVLGLPGYRLWTSCSRRAGIALMHFRMSHAPQRVRWMAPAGRGSLVFAGVAVAVAGRAAAAARAGARDPTQIALPFLVEMPWTERGSEHPGLFGVEAAAARAAKLTAPTPAEKCMLPLYQLYLM